MKNDDIGKIPSIRFKGFTAPWEQRKLSDMMDFSNGINAPKENYGFGTKMISVMDILSPRSIAYEKIINSVSVEKKVEENNKVENGDLIFVRSSEIVEEVGWSKAYLDQKHALYSGFSIRGKKKDVFNSYFVELSLNYSNRKDIERKAGGSTRFNVNQEILRNIKILMPEEQEENYIASMFTHLEHMIALHQRKLDKTKELKKTLLSKMFAKNGENKPELRFSGFTDAWEQRKLKDISMINPTSKIPTNFNYVDLESVQGTELKTFRRESIETAPSRAQRLAINGDLFYQTVRPYQKNNYLFKRDDRDFVFSTGYAQLRPEIDGDFLLSLVQTTKFVNSVLVRCTGTSYPAINSSDLGVMPIRVPKSNVESINIGMLFSSIDNTITLHQRELEQLKNIRKTLLKHMFV